MVNSAVECRAKFVVPGITCFDNKFYMFELGLNKKPWNFVSTEKYRPLLLVLVILKGVA